MRIITINREFGSGGREVGKRLADVLHYRYYDSEIINAISLESNMDEGYVSSMLESGSFWDFPITYGNTFASFAEPQSNLTRLLVAERRVILDIAKKGENCVIVGRNADEILHGYHPFKIFVYAEMHSKIARCMEREKDGSHMTEKEMKKRIERIDSVRRRRNQLVGGGKWGAKESYNLCVNTTGCEIQKIVPGIADYIQAWFESCHAE